MKNRIIIAALSIFSLSACSKSALDNNNGSGTANVIPASSVPSAVMTSFNNSFSNATETEWQRHSSSFEVQFNHSSQRHSAGFDDNGHQSSHSVICLEAAVPQVVLDAFRSRFPTDNVYEWKLRNDGTWRAHIMRGSVKYEATFSASGAFIKFEQAK
ncbi:MAG: hypothetical protein HZB42_14410 [Sphingobacteriales bacterium]|nr:hypothetical protein [Sphingobacteriales bacterium]